jgi:hypothetical protein
MEFNELDDIPDRVIFLNTDDAGVLKLGKRLATTKNKNMLILNCKHESEGIRTICKIRLSDSRMINPDYIEDCPRFFSELMELE